MAAEASRSGPEGCSGLQGKRKRAENPIPPALNRPRHPARCAALAITFSRHARDKLEKELSKLGVSEEQVREAVSKPDELLYDTATGRYVALKWKEKLAVIYERRGSDIFIVTAIYSSKLENVVQRRRRGARRANRPSYNTLRRPRKTDPNRNPRR